MNKKAHVAFQSLFGALALLAVIAQLQRHVGFSFNTVNFFSYFTNLSNLFAAVILLAGGQLLYENKTSRVYDILRGASVLYMAVVGIVFSLLLRNTDLGTLIPWVNIVLHYVMPIIVVGYWFVSPPKSRINLKAAAYWLVLPVVYLVYSLIRGAALNWYPYPFLNPEKSGGYPGVALYCALILIIFVVFGLVIKKRVRS